MPKAKEINKKYPEVKDIQDDIQSLKSDTIELAKHIKKDGVEKTEEFKEVVTEQVQSLAETGQQRLKSVESKVKQKPLQSLAIAFAAGMTLSVLLGRR